MKRILVVFAMKVEAHPFLKSIGAQEGEWVSLSDDLQLLTVISGMGVVAAAAVTALWVREVDEIWNFGFAGALHEGLELGKIYKVNQVGKHLSLPEEIDGVSKRIAKKLFSPISLGTDKGLSLVSSDYPIYDRSHLDQTFDGWDLVDMEGYGICQVADKHGVPCRLHKVVSDFADENTHQVIIQGYRSMAASLADMIHELSRPTSSALCV